MNRFPVCARGDCDYHPCRAASGDANKHTTDGASLRCRLVRDPNVGSHGFSPVLTPQSMTTRAAAVETRIVKLHVRTHGASK